MNALAPWYQVQFCDISDKWCNYPMLLTGKRFGIRKDAETFMIESMSQSPQHARWPWRIIEVDIGGNAL